MSNPTHIPSGRTPQPPQLVHQDHIAASLVYYVLPIKNAGVSALEGRDRKDGIPPGTCGGKEVPGVGVGRAIPG